MINEALKLRLKSLQSDQKLFQNLVQNEFKRANELTAESLHEHEYRVTS